MYPVPCPLHIEKVVSETPEDQRAPSMQALKIAHKPGLLALFSSHTPLDERINRLQKMTNV